MMDAAPRRRRRLGFADPRWADCSTTGSPLRW